MTKLERSLKRTERLAAVWHIGLAGLYLFAFGFHLWSAWEHAQEGFEE